MMMCFISKSTHLQIFQIGLLNFFVNSYFLQDWVVFFQLQPFRGVLFVFSADIAACASHTACFMLCAFQNHLHPVAFLCHCSIVKIVISYLLLGGTSHL